MNKDLKHLSGFFISHAAYDHPTRRILSSALKDVNMELCSYPYPYPYPYSDSKPLLWDAAYLGLDRVSLFQKADRQLQEQILKIANLDLLEEIYWVEQAGVGYMAKMLTLSETHEERLLYALFAADEATHLSTIHSFLETEPIFRGDGFLAYMGKLLDSNDKALLMTLVQVVLEGWGLTHYRSLAKYCIDPQFANILQGFLEAESRHHALGVTQVQAYSEYSSDSLKNIYAALTDFLYMVQVGPQRLLGAIAKVLGYLSVTDKIQIMEEFDTEQYTNSRLKLLRSLMAGTVPDSIMQSLEECGYFQAYSAKQCT